MAIAIRRAEPEDYELLCRIFADESAYSGTLQAPFPSVDDWRKRMAQPAEGDYMLLAHVDGEIAGQAGIHAAGKSPRRAHVRMLGIGVHSRFQGKGVGKALMTALVDLADKWLPVTRIELTVFTDNERAIALYREFGFEIEGTHKAYGLRDGRYADVYSMARIRDKNSGV
ncbi:MAG: GNAT family N-acetyltransferase [Burkholderiales bacterium]|nr:GNAT family N-acetyltransferase [Burkholderiales bacterium]